MGVTQPPTKHREGGTLGSDRPQGGVFIIRQSGDAVDISSVKFAPMEKEALGGDASSKEAFEPPVISSLGPLLTSSNLFMAHCP